MKTPHYQIRPLLHTQNTVLHQIFSPGTSSFFSEEKLNTVMPWRIINYKLILSSPSLLLLAGSGAEEQSGGTVR